MVGWTICQQSFTHQNQFKTHHYVTQCSHFSFICMFCRSLFVFLCFFFLPLCCLFFTLQILITCLISIGHCVVCPSLYRFWLPVWYLLAIVLSVLRFTDSDYLFGIYWPLCCLSFALQILITCLVTSNSSWNFHTSMNNYRHFWKYWILNIAFKCIFCRYRQTESRLQEAKPGWSISKNRFCPCV